MTLHEAVAEMTNVPTHLLNDNCIQDAQKRLRDAIDLAGRGPGSQPAPDFVRKAVANLHIWIGYCA